MLYNTCTPMRALSKHTNTSYMCSLHVCIPAVGHTVLYLFLLSVQRERSAFSQAGVSANVFFLSDYYLPLLPASDPSIFYGLIPQWVTGVNILIAGRAVTDIVLI